MQAEVGIFGGSGFYTFAEGKSEEELWKPHGAPSDKLTITTIAGRKLPFCPDTAGTIGSSHD